MAIRKRIQLFVAKLKQLFRKEPPADPYAYVMAPKRPRPPYQFGGGCGAGRINIYAELRSA